MLNIVFYNVSVLSVKTHSKPLDLCSRCSQSMFPNQAPASISIDNHFSSCWFACTDIPLTISHSMSVYWQHIMSKLALPLSMQDTVHCPLSLLFASTNHSVKYFCHRKVDHHNLIYFEWYPLLTLCIYVLRRAPSWHVSLFWNALAVEPRISCLLIIQTCTGIITLGETKDQVRIMEAYS